MFVYVPAPGAVPDIGKMSTDQGEKQFISIFRGDILNHVQEVIITHWKNYLLYLYLLKTEKAAEVVNDKRTSLCTLYTFSVNAGTVPANCLWVLVQQTAPFVTQNTCSCTAGKVFCQHVIAILFQIMHNKTLGLTAAPPLV